MNQQLLDELFAAIIADPESNDRRWVYADALDDAGQGARAEYIRTALLLDELPRMPNVVRLKPGQCFILVQPAYEPHLFCEHIPIQNSTEEAIDYHFDAEWKLDESHEKRLSLTVRLRELIAANPEWYVLPPGGNITTEMDRGFINRLRCPWYWWAEHAAEAMANAPIEQVHFTTEVAWDCELNHFEMRNWTSQVWLQDSEVRALAIRTGRQMQEAAALLPHHYTVPQLLLALRWPGISFDLPAGPASGSGRLEVRMTTGERERFRAEWMAIHQGAG